jgi:hypothetical protein
VDDDGNEHGMNVELTLHADAQFTDAGKPGMRRHPKDAARAARGSLHGDGRCAYCDSVLLQIASVFLPRFPGSVGLGRFPSRPPGTGNADRIEAGALEIIFVMFAQLAKHRQMQPARHACALPVAQSSAACHAAA